MTNTALGSERPTIRQEMLLFLRWAFRWLYASGKHRGHWGDLKSTALATSCLALRGALDREWIDEASRWILSQKIDHEDGGSCWGRQVWDTALALIALRDSGLTANAPVLLRGKRWLFHMAAKNPRDTWHDDVWETSWAIIALSRVEMDLEEQRLVAKALRWLGERQDHNGQIISPADTALALLAAQGIKEALKSENPTTEFDEMIQRATKGLAEYAAEHPDTWSQTLWSNELWSNGLVVYALSNCDRIDDEQVLTIVRWFRAQESATDLESEDSDWLMALLGLHALLLQFESQREVSGKGDSHLSVQLALREELGVQKLEVRRKLWDRTTSEKYYIINLPKRTSKLIVFISGGALGWMKAGEDILARMKAIWQLLTDTLAR